MRLIDKQGFSQFIVELRHSTGLTQEQFAAFLGVTYPTISRWENRRSNPSLMAIKLIEQKLLDMGEYGRDLRKRYLTTCSNASYKFSEIIEEDESLALSGASLNRNVLELFRIDGHRGNQRKVSSTSNPNPIPKAFPAAIPSNEAERLEALYRYNILDTSPEAAFDDLTSLASYICGTPIALVSLVDANRQWFKSKVGLKVTETPRELAFCAHALLSPSELLIVPNVLEDERFATNPLVLSDPNIRFYTGVPLMTPDNFPVGTLCVIDRIPRRLNSEQIDALRALGRQVITQMELRLALEKEKELNELKSRFISMTSHEFRTPLTTILGSAELLQHYSYKWPQEKKTIHFKRIHSNVQHLVELLNDVLIIGQAEARKLEFNPEPLDVIQFCCTLVEELQVSLGSEHTIVFRCQLPELEGCLDEKLLRQTFSNLLSNAIKYSPIGSTINFELICQDEQAIFQIQDFGIGIPLAEQKHLFESFYRAKNVGNIPGTGLGLAIVKSSVYLQEGKITVESEVGVGTTFTVTIPLNKKRQAITVESSRR